MKMNYPKLSILVTFCKQNKFIEEALNSIFEQNVDFSFEVVIGLDAPDNETFKILSKYKKKFNNIRVITCNNTNLNTINIEKASINRINLIKEANGEYFCILDGDDFYIDKNRFQKLIDILDEKKEIIGCAHKIAFFDNKNKKFKSSKSLCKKESLLSIESYIKKNIHISASAFIFRNIFCNEIPNDFPEYFFNDSTITLYMLRYGKFYYIPQEMLTYRTNISSIFNAENGIVQNFTVLLACEINNQILSAYSDLYQKRYKKVLTRCIGLLIRNSCFRLPVLEKFAKEHNCYFTHALLTHEDLNKKEKINLLKNLFSLIFLNKNINEPNKHKLFYFDSRPNFGDILNLYIFQRILGINVKKAKPLKADTVAIGSLLEGLMNKRVDSRLCNPCKQINVWGSGFIEPPNKKRHPNQKFRKKVNIIALRGTLSKSRCEKMLNQKLNNVVLGDPGILASKLINLSTIEKQYQVGVISHYVDKNTEFIKNIKLKNYKFINVEDNVLKVLKEISQCEFILSSAMHGLIVADSLNIPNKWIRFSDKVYGGDYKFKDYYSVFGIENPTPIDLRENIINIDDIEKLKKEYYKIDKTQKVKEIQNDLIESFKSINL